MGAVAVASGIEAVVQRGEVATFGCIKLFQK